MPTPDIAPLVQNNGTGRKLRRPVLAWAVVDPSLLPRPIASKAEAAGLCLANKLTVFENIRGFVGGQTFPFPLRPPMNT